MYKLILAFSVIFITCFGSFFSLLAEIDSDGGTCALHNSEGAKFLWTTSKDSPGSDITLTYGGCSGGGESGTAYIFAGFSPVGSLCDCDPDTFPCDGDSGTCYDEVGTEGDYGVTVTITVSGDEELFKSFFPGGLYVLAHVADGDGGTACNFDTYITEIDEECEIPMTVMGNVGPLIKLIAGVKAFGVSDEEETFDIEVKFYEKRIYNIIDGEPATSCYTEVDSAKGSITVKPNKEKENGSTGGPSTNGEAAWMKSNPRAYDGSDSSQSEWSVGYKVGDLCCEDVTGWIGPHSCTNPVETTIVPGSATHHRAKVPGYKEDVNNTLPEYMSNRGWDTDPDEGYISLELGEFGTFYYHCGHEDSEGRNLLTKVEYCESGEIAGQGDILWFM